MHHRCRDGDRCITDADTYRHRTDTDTDASDTEMKMNTSQMQTYIDIGRIHTKTQIQRWR